MMSIDELRAAVHIAIALCGVSLATVGQAEIYRFGISGRPLFCISSKNAFNFALPQPSLALEPKSWPTDLMSLRYNASEIRREIPIFYANPNYRPDDSPNVLSVDVSLVSQAYTRKSLGGAAGSDAAGIWSQSARCKNPTVVVVPGTSYFLAKCDPTNFWHILFDREPKGEASAKEIYGHVLAECTHTSVGFGPHTGQELENCTRRIFIENLRVDYDFQIENAKIIPQIDDFLRTQEKLWKKNCSEKADTTRD